jgi:hypothetical protein
MAMLFGLVHVENNIVYSKCIVDADHSCVSCPTDLACFGCLRSTPRFFDQEDTMISKGTASVWHHRAQNNTKEEYAT